MQGGLGGFGPVRPLPLRGAEPWSASGGIFPRKSLFLFHSHNSGKLHCPLLYFLFFPKNHHFCFTVTILGNCTAYYYTFYSTQGPALHGGRGLASLNLAKDASLVEFHLRAKFQPDQTDGLAAYRSTTHPQTHKHTLPNIY